MESGSNLERVHNRAHGDRVSFKSHPVRRAGYHVVTSLALGVKFTALRLPHELLETVDDELESALHMDALAS